MKYLFFTILVSFSFWWVAEEAVPLAVEPDTPVSEVLKALGDNRLMNNMPNKTLQHVSAERGKQLFLEGLSVSPKGKKMKKQSRHFVCTSCHNIEREDPDLRYSDPQARLDYVTRRGMPFLQGTTLYGAVNRTSFYNGDYYKKYGDLVYEARNNIREAIQLCATECAQGRKLKHWEVESILAYLWTLELKMDDLNLTEQEYPVINNAIQNGQHTEAAVDLITSRYLAGSPATFIPPPENRQAGQPDIVPNPENGKLIYQHSCLHCHEGERYSFFNLDESKLSFQYLHKHFPKYTRYSTYQVTRWGTEPLPGKGAYMPHYTAERMSVQQLEDLRAYVASQVVEAGEE